MNFIQRLRKKTRQVLNIVYKALTNRGHVNYKNQGIINLIDVGAIGELPHPWFNNARYINKLLRFEPREKASTQPNVLSFDYAIGSRDEIRPFHIYKGNDSHGSSFYEPNFEYVTNNFEELRKIGLVKLAETWFDRSKLIRTINIESRTLDSVLATLDVTFDFLKIDAQGAEYEILTGAQGFLKTHCIGLQLELFNFPIYKGIKVKQEVISFLDERGFELAKEFPSHGTFNCAADYIFLKKKTNGQDSEKMTLLRKIYGLKSSV